MKKALCGIAILVFVAGVSFAKSSSYRASCEQLTVSSQTVNTINLMNGYRLLNMSNLSADVTMYFSIEASTLTVLSVGYPIFPHTEKVIDYNGAVYLQAPAGTAGGSVGILKFEK